MATAIGTVTNLMGTATATAADGSIRQLNVGDKVFQNDLINTNAVGAIEIEFDDGNVMALGRGSQALLDSQYFGAAESLAANPEADSIDIDAIQQALLDGSDPTLIAQATAAGAGIQESEGGHDAVFIDYLAPETAVQAGFETAGVNAAGNNVPEFFLDEDEGLFLVEPISESSASLVTPPQSGLPLQTAALSPVNDGGNPPIQQSTENSDNQPIQQNPEIPGNADLSDTSGQDTSGQQPNLDKLESTDGNNDLGNDSDTDDQLPGTPPVNDDEGSQPGNSDNPNNQLEVEAPNSDDQPSQGGPNGNNGFGNGDQDAPGNSGDNNNAENSSNEGQDNSGQGQPGSQGNSSNMPEDEPLNAEDLVTEETEALFPEDQASQGGPNGNNGFGNGDQDAPGNSADNNNAENSSNEGHGNSAQGQSESEGNASNMPEDEPLNAEDLVTEETEALFPEDQASQGGSKGNNGHGNGDQDAPGKSADNNNAENSEHSGQGNSGKGQGGGLGQSVNFSDIANSVLDNGGDNGLL